MLKNSLKLVKRNFVKIIKYEIIYHVIVSIILFLLGLFQYWLLETNQLSFVLPILTVATIIFLFSITVINSIYLICLYDKTYHNKKIKLLSIKKLVINKFQSMFVKSRVKIWLLLLFFIPFLYIPVIIYVLLSVFVDLNIYIIAWIFILYLLYLILFLKCLYSFHFLIIDDLNFKKAKLFSVNMTKASDIINIFVVQLIFVFILTALYFLTNKLSVLNIFVSYNIARKTYEFLIFSLSIFVISLYVVFVNSLLSSLFYNHKIFSKQLIKPIKISKAKSKNTILVFIIGVVILLAVSFLTQLIKDNNKYKKEFDIDNIIITAHRGNSVDYPENTMIAFRGAKNQKAKWIELDVQQTEDKKLVIFHDYTLYRISGIDESIFNMKYNEVKDIDVGRSFNEKFSNQKIPLLEEAIKYAKKSNINLNIEIKEYDVVDYEKELIDILNKYDYEKKCVVSSTSYRVLRNIKKLNKNIKTALVSGPIEDNMFSLTDIDAFSFEATTLDSITVKKAHLAGKEVFAWTVNDEVEINRMISMHVDNIITDDVKLAEKILKSWKVYKNNS